MRGGEALIHTIKSYYGDDCPALISGVPREVMRWPFQAVEKMNDSKQQLSIEPRDGYEVAGTVFKAGSSLKGNSPSLGGELIDYAEHAQRNRRPVNDYQRTALHALPMNVIRAPNEYTAAAMAAGFADNTQKTGIVAVTRGPGAAGAIQQLLMADAYQKPVVLLATTGPFSDLPHESGWQHIIYDKVFPPFAKKIIVAAPRRYLGSKEARQWQNDPKVEVLPIEQATMKALELANDGIKGPVILVTSSDAMEEEIGDVNIPKPIMLKPNPAASAILDKAVTMINQAQKPVIIYGPGARHNEAEVQKLAKAIHAPYCGTYDDQAPRLDHPNYLTDLGYLPPLKAKERVNESDLIIMVGDKHIGRRETNEYLALKDQDDLKRELAAHHTNDPNQIDLKNVKDKRIIYIHEDRLKDHPSLQRLEAVQQVMGDLPKTLLALANKPFRVFPERTEWTKKAHQETVGYYKQPFDTGRFVNPAKLFQAMDKHLPEESVVYSDTGGFMTFFGVVNGSKHKIVRGTSECMALAPGQVIGYALADMLDQRKKGQKRKYVLVIGDGGMDMNGQNSLKLMQDLGMDLTVVVINNRGDGAIFNAERKLPGTESSSGYGTFQNTTPTDWCKIARAHGIDDAIRASKEDIFEKAFAAAMRKPGVKFIEAVVSIRTPTLGSVYSEVKPSLHQKLSYLDAVTTHTDGSGVGGLGGGR